MVSRKADAAVGAATAVLGGVLLFQSRVILSGPFSEPLGSRGLPVAVSVLLIAGGVVVAARYPWRSLRKNPDSTIKEGSEDEPGHPVSLGRPWYLLCASFVYCYLVGSLGFLITTPLLICVSMFVVTAPRWRVAVLVLVPLGFTVAIYLLFGVVLGVRLPEGPLGQLLVRVGLPTALGAAELVA